MKTRLKKTNMKKLIIIFTLTIISLNGFSQVRNYDDTAILIAQDNTKGTARFTGMSGAFGALGGNLSAADINPAGLVVFNSSEASLTLDYRESDIATHFLTNKNTTTSDNFGFAQIGGVLIFENNKENWNKFAFGFNMTKNNDFDNEFIIKGNDGHSNQDYFHLPVVGADLYNNVDSQYLSSITKGSKTSGNFTFAAKYDKNTSFGVSIITKSIEYSQIVAIKETSTDVNGNTFLGNSDQNLDLYGDGYGISLGVISKLSKNIRAGLSYQSPIWYSLTEDASEKLNLSLSNDVLALPHLVEPNTFEYKLKTPSKATASFAYIFGKKGLISLDYAYKDYSKTKLGPSSDFDGSPENKNLAENLSSISEIRIGGEYRIKKMSFRAGYHFGQNPYVNMSNDTKDGYSAGLGFNLFKNTKLDLSYDFTNTSDKYRYIDSPNSSIQDIDNNRINATISIGL